jgi:cation diffusion facilitator family transporter
LFTFGTGKVGILGGYTSGITLLIVAAVMAFESIQRLFIPSPIRFNEAIMVAVIGLGINLFSAYLLGSGAHHDEENLGLHEPHDHDHHEHGGDGKHHDHNLRAAYLHVIADALTSVLAIVALVAGKAFGWIWMDALMGLVGSVVITRWSWGLLKVTSKILLDSGADPGLTNHIRSVLEKECHCLVSDLHIWHLDGHHLAAVISIETSDPKSATHYKTFLKDIQNLTHITIEVNGAAE